jgi:hypothetical protein
MTIVEADPSYTVDQLNAFVTQSEKRLMGPLTAIGNNTNGKTTLTIDERAPSNPTPPSKITTGQLPVGATKIGDGRVYISGTLTDAIAYKT